MRKRFVLKKQGVAFSDRQKMNIDYHIDLERNWKNFKDLISIKLLNIDDNSFVVEVEEVNDKWHSIFSQNLCRWANLDDLCVENNSGRELFDVLEE